MMGVEEARRIMMAQVRLMPTHALPLDEATGGWLSEVVVAPYDHPRFDMSAVDGFAVNGEGPTWPVVYAIPAGGVMDRPLQPGECARIFTGAAVPKGTRSIIMQERGVHRDGWFTVSGTLPASDANIRRRAEALRQNEPLLSAGTRIDPGAVGLLSSAGVGRVRLHVPPQVAVIRTGDEFIDDGPVEEGRIFSSNEVMLLSALRKEGILMDHHFTARDVADDVRSTVLEALGAHDVLVMTGGVSVGDHDLVASVLRGLGAGIHFHGVSQKPGKPMLFATLDGKPVFGLPGNPRAVLVLFWEYVLPFLRAMQGARDPWLKNELLPLAHPIHVKGERAEFRPARVKEGRVTLLADEGSHMLRSLVDADALAYLPQGRTAWEQGDGMEVHYLPQ